MPEPTPITEARKSALERLLSVFTQVKAGEGVSALLLALNVFLLLGAYYLLKTVREPLILGESGAEAKSYAAAGQAMLFLILVPAYGGLAARVNRIRLITWVTLFFISHLGIFYLLGTSGVRVGVAFFLWVGIFNMLVTAQFWAFANDIFTEEQGGRLFPMVGVGSSLGAWIGSLVAAKLFDVFEPAAAPYQMMLVAGVLLVLCILVSHLVNRPESRREVEAGAPKADKSLGKEGGFGLVFKQRYLFLIAMLILLLNGVNTTGEFILGKVVTVEAEAEFGEGDETEAQRKTYIGSFYGDFFSWVNLLGFLFQLFLVSRLFKYIGVRGAMFPGFPFWPSWSVYDSRLPAAMQRFSHCCQVRYSFRCRSGLRMLADHGVPAKPEGPLATPLPRRPSATRVRWLFRAVDVTLRAQVAPKSAAACRRTTSGSDAPPQAATNNIARASRAVRPSSSADAASSSATSF